MSVSTLFQEFQILQHISTCPFYLACGLGKQCGLKLPEELYESGCPYYTQHLLLFNNIAVYTVQASKIIQKHGRMLNDVMSSTY